MSVSLDHTNDPPSTPKDDLRREAERMRATLRLQGNESEAAAQRLTDHFADQFWPGQVVGVYWPMRHELDTLPLIEKLTAKGLPVALPVVQDRAGPLVFHRLSAKTPLQPGAFGAMIPTGEDALPLDPDYLIVPVLAFDRGGYRLGYGGGFYDRTIADLRARRHLTTIGYAYAEQLCLFRLPNEAHDIRLDYVVTPQQVHIFGP